MFFYKNELQLLGIGVSRSVSRGIGQVLPTCMSPMYNVPRKYAQ